MSQTTEIADAATTGQAGKNLVGGNATGSKVPEGATPARATISYRGKRTNREATEGVGATLEGLHRPRTEWGGKEGGLADPHGTPLANAAQRANRTCQGADPV